MAKTPRKAPASKSLQSELFQLDWLTPLSLPVAHDTLAGRKTPAPAPTKSKRAAKKKRG